MGKLFDAYVRSYKLSAENDADYFELVGDLYFSQQVQSLAQYEQHLDINRLQHVTSVSYLSYVISKELGWQYRMIARGTLLHDLFYYDWRDPEGNWHRPHGYKHPKFAILNAVELDKSLNEIQKDMIRHHMFPLTMPPKYKEGLVIVFADKYCASRELIYSLSKRYKQKFNSLIKE